MVVPTDSKSWVLITGASSGIGEVFARRFASEGWNTILVARSADKLERLARVLADENNVETIVVPTDLTDRNAPRKVYHEVQQKGIVVEGLINNAGCGAGGKFAEAPLEHLLQVVDLNVRSVVELTHLFLAGMIQRKRGFILNVSSTACFQPVAYLAVYAATKSFVTLFTEALWLETRGTGVRVLNLCPGLTKTDFGTVAGMGNFHSDPWAQEPEEVVEVALQALRRNMPTAISGWQNRLRILLQRLFPHRVLLELVLLFQKMRGRV